MMADLINGVILQKLQTLDQVLVELRSLGQVKPSQLESDWRTRRAIERLPDFERFRTEVLAYVQN
jgi:hypothetical protein